MRLFQTHKTSFMLNLIIFLISNPISDLMVMSLDMITQDPKFCIKGKTLGVTLIPPLDNFQFIR